MFWTATAPLSGQGHVNLSPKCTRGMFHIVNQRRVWYEDMSGSGVETISHLKEPGNGRITILFHAFEGPPRIVRLFGTGTVYEFGTPEYNQYISPETRAPGSRAVIMIDVHKVGTSCGYAIPFYEFKSHRNQLLQWAQKREATDDEYLQMSSASSSDDEPEHGQAGMLANNGMRSYWKQKNAHSIDGIPALNTQTFEVTHQAFNTAKKVYTSDHKAIAASVKKANGVWSFGSDVMLDPKFLTGLTLGVATTAVVTKLLVR
ncbi:hypothetical protein GYMLUDRAFT_45051 [Collybiopsis luxurians FD-317 M1]|uniref:Pyridoxamine 5'-phosphate oxidase putative domain-containing protein n=1 Tax=Collybiopsis luxurians FD-317 M1 TaxID=944289 RepID=A0A0D0CSP2_9AGAR|nr:hypothetical protein GYMLUDRAFT_45051 [Collybiopsis luxurians FD-317 M1]